MTEEEKKIQEAMLQYKIEFEHLLDEIPLPVTDQPGNQEEYFIPSSDGVRLETWLYFPLHSEGPVSTIAVRSCYPNQEELLIKKAEAFNRRGFGFAIQWCRGTHRSEGDWVPNVHEREDGLAFMDFLQQDARVLNVGYWGDSYLAMTGWCMADAVPSKVKAMCLNVYGCFRHVSAYQDGLFRQDILTSWAMENAGKMVNADYLESAAFRPQIEVDEKMWGIRLDWYRDWITHTDADDPYWEEGFWGMMKEIPSKIRIPLYIREGWYDHHLGSALCSWNALAEKTKAMSILEIGPWNHYSNVCIEHQTTKSLRNNSISGPALWFDGILRKGMEPAEEIRLYEVGGDTFEKYQEYPVPVKESRVFYLRAGSDPINHKLTSAEGAEQSSVSYVYDPNDPVISHGAESTLHLIQENGSLLQAEVNARGDVISFVSDSLQESLHVNGQISVHLFVSSDARDTAFTAKLMEVFEDGSAYNVRGTITTLAYRNGASHRGTYRPGEIVRITLNMWDIDWLFQKGSRLRLDISSSDFPQYAVHTNHEGIWSLQKDTIIAHQTIYTGGDTPSDVILPLVIH
ncbi:MAG: CocE/NonD family hydrolase [Oribacterium sp.]|nr:CocE/NonD family hydrolase [Oribacterium sp.]